MRFLVWYQIVVLPRLMVSTGKIPEVKPNKLHHLDSLSTKRTIVPSLLSSPSALFGVWNSGSDNVTTTTALLSSSPCLANNNINNATTATATNACSIRNVDFKTSITDADSQGRLSSPRIDDDPLASTSQHHESTSLLQDLFLGIVCLVFWNLIRHLYLVSSLTSATIATTDQPPETAESTIPKILPFLYMVFGGNKHKNWKLSLVAVVALLLSQMVVPSLNLIDILYSVYYTLIQTSISYISTSYMNCLEEYPLATKCVTTACMQVIGDIVAQWNEESTRRYQALPPTPQDEEERKKEIQLSPHESATSTSPATTVRRFPPTWYDRRRGLSAFTDGLLISGPLMHFCFERLEDWIPTSDEYDDDEEEDGLISALQHA